ncbi:MAG: glutamate racemase [Leptolyngbyaceae cyanobacterium]
MAGTADDVSTCAPIGVFDSGLGGLTVLQQLQRELPHESILYFGDTANLPYGEKTADEILQLVRSIVQWMVAYPVKMVVMACNTSSALALDIVRSEFDIPILGVILPAAQMAVQSGDRVGVLATPATAHSGAYRRAIREINPRAMVWEIGCPEFVPLIEAGQICAPETPAIVQRYLEPLLEQQINTLVYGCTHYPHLAPIVDNLLPPSVQVVDPAISVSKAVAQELALLGHKEHGLDSGVDIPSNFFVSDRPRRFSRLATRLLGYEVSASQITLAPSPLPYSVDVGKAPLEQR